MKVFILLSMLFSQTSFAEVECLVTISVSDVYFAQTNGDQSIAVEADIVRLNSHKKCKKYKLGISTGSAGNYARKLYNGTQAVRYNFHKSENTSAPIKSLDDAQGGNDSVAFRIKNTSNKVTFYASLPDPFVSGSIPVGQYFDTVVVSVAPTSNSTTGSTSVNMSSYLNVLSDVNISLVDRGGQFDPNNTNQILDFGMMVTGETKGFDLIVQSNTGYTISVSSESDGGLEHIANSNYKIGYNFIVNGSTMSLVGSKVNPLTIFTSSGESLETGDVIEIDVSLLDTTNKLAGSYTDYIYFTATSTY